MPANADCRGGVFATRRFPRPSTPPCPYTLPPPCAYTYPSPPQPPYAPTIAPPSSYHRRTSSSASSDFITKSEHEAAQVRRRYDDGTEHPPLLCANLRQKQKHTIRTRWRRANPARIRALFAWRRGLCSWALVQKNKYLRGENGGLCDASG